MEDNRERHAHDVWGIISERKVTLRGMSVREASEALDVSERTIFRMLEDGRLVGNKAYLPDGKYIWDIDTLSVARLLVRKEVEDEVRKEKEHKKK
jgi:predicted DNA-binding transcriptional regulator YafY